jgi:hypothetical protein
LHCFALLWLQPLDNVSDHSPSHRWAWPSPSRQSNVLRHGAVYSVDEQPLNLPAPGPVVFYALQWLSLDDHHEDEHIAPRGSPSGRPVRTHSSCPFLLLSNSIQWMISLHPQLRLMALKCDMRTWYKWALHGSPPLAGVQLLDNQSAAVVGYLPCHTELSSLRTQHPKLNQQAFSETVTRRPVPVAKWFRTSQTSLCSRPCN